MWEAAEVTEEETCRLPAIAGVVKTTALVQPCACRGTARLIHEHCLEEWR